MKLARQMDDIDIHDQKKIHEIMKKILAEHVFRLNYMIFIPF